MINLLKKMTIRNLDDFWVNFKGKGVGYHATDNSKQIHAKGWKVQLSLYLNIYKPSDGSERLTRYHVSKMVTFSDHGVKKMTT